MNKRELLELILALPEDVEDVLIAHGADGYDSPKRLRVIEVIRDHDGAEHWHGQYAEAFEGEGERKVAVLE